MKTNENKYMQAVYPTTWNFLRRAGWPTRLMYCLGMIRSKRTGYADGSYYTKFEFRLWNPLLWVVVLFFAALHFCRDIYQSLTENEDIEISISMPLKLRERKFNDPSITVEDMTEDINHYNQ